MTPRPDDAVERDQFEQALADEFGNVIDRLKLESYEYHRLVKAGVKAIVAHTEAALAEKEAAHAETRGLVRDLTNALEKRNTECRDLRAALAERTSELDYLSRGIREAKLSEAYQELDTLKGVVERGRDT